VVDGVISYSNVFDANFDTLVTALTKVGAGNLPIIVGEVGWPTDGDKHATAAYAQRFYKGLLPRLAKNTGTPLRPNQYIEMYLFGLIDEDAKSIAPGNFERHWGILKYDGQPKFQMDLTGQDRPMTLVPAQKVEYLSKTWCVIDPNGKNLDKIGDDITWACTYSDCTSLGYGSTCNGMDTNGNASYAFNMYFQVQNQVDESCDFGGRAVTTTQDPSTNACNFTIQIKAAPFGAASMSAPHSIVMILVTLFLVLLFV
jgi:Glycosyl hydrolases family 17/X8 domain